jgi:hypothetical protein
VRRIVRRVNAPGIPRTAIQSVLAEAGIGGTQIDLAVIATSSSPSLDSSGAGVAGAVSTPARSLGPRGGLGSS